MRRLGAFARRTARSLIATWQGQNEFGRALMAMGAVSAVASLVLALDLALYSALPWRGLPGAGDAPPWLPTPSPALAALPTGVPSPTPTATPPRSPTPSPTPTATRAPTPTATRLPTLRPASRIEVSARVSDSSPKRGAVVTVYGQITKDGVGVAGVLMETEWEFRSITVPCDSTTNSDGVASCSLPILLAAKGQYVTVQVAFTYQGQTYRATTGFTPR